MEFSEYEKMRSLEENNWWYVGRRDLVLSFIAQIRNGFFRGPLRILDAGCGTGINLKHLQGYGYAEGLDISKEALRISSERGLSSLTCGSIDRLPYKGSVFDIILALDVLEHMEDDLSAIKELFRVLRPDGFLIITVPAFQFLWTNHDLAVHHKRRYVLSELLSALQLGGFKIEKATYWNFFLFPPVAMMRLIKSFAQSGGEANRSYRSSH